MNPVHLINLTKIPNMGQQRIRMLMSHLGEKVNPFEFSVSDLCRVKGINQKTARDIKAYRDFDYALKEIDRAGEKGISILTFWDDNYPMLLKKIYGSPILLYYRGRELREKEDSVAIVGTRNFTPYGKSATKRITADLASKKMTIVSGLARGIDTIAHKETVSMGGRTIAVFGSGLDVVYPAENRKLADAICERGTLISEFPLGTKPDRGNFPQRNRIISGLAHATVVMEAGDRSGAILTALNAVDQNRDIFAAPGRITDKQSIGANRLIRNGAIPVTSGDDVIREINPRLFHHVESVQRAIRIELMDQERTIMDNLGHDPVHIDELANTVDINISSLLQILLKLELKNAVQQIGGKQFVRA